MRTFMKLAIVGAIGALVWRRLARSRGETVTLDPADFRPLGADQLYGVSVREVEDIELIGDDDDATAEGETWMEALSTQATEDGPPIEDELDIPVADRGNSGAI